MSSVNLSEELLSQFFARNSDLSTKAKFWSLPDLPTYNTIHMSGDFKLVRAAGEVTHFPQGAFIFQKADGAIDALPTRAAGGGGITVNGGPVRDVVKDVYSGYYKGNMAHMQYNAETSRLSVSMPEGHYGIQFRYPAPTAPELAAMAEKHGAIIFARDSGGKLIEGFFVNGKGGIMPSALTAFHNGVELKGGEFLAIHREATGEVRGLFPYKPYTEKEIAEFTRGGTMSPPGNNVAHLQNVDGAPLVAEAGPRFNVETGQAKYPWGYRASSIDVSALRNEFLAESVRSAESMNKLKLEFPDTYGKPALLDEAALRETAGKLFDEKAKTVGGQSLLLAETDAMRQMNLKRMGPALAEGKPLLSLASETKLALSLAPESKLALSLAPENKLLSLAPDALSTLKLDTSKLPQGLLVQEERSLLGGFKFGRGAKAAGILGLTLLGAAAVDYAAQSYFKSQTEKKKADEPNPDKNNDLGKALGEFSKAQKFTGKDYSLEFDQLLKDSAPRASFTIEKSSGSIDELLQKSTEKHDEPAAKEAEKQADIRG